MRATRFIMQLSLQYIGDVRGCDVTQAIVQSDEDRHGYFLMARGIAGAAPLSGSASFKSLSRTGRLGGVAGAVTGADAGDVTAAVGTGGAGVEPVTVDAADGTVGAVPTGVFSGTRCRVEGQV